MDKKWSKKKKIITAVIVVAIVALVAAVLYIAFKPEESVKTEITTIKSGDITETFDTTALVQSANQSVFQIYDGVVVKEVKVRVGDNVKKGDVLATFDTSSLNALLSEKRDAYNIAQKAYNDYLNGAYSAGNQLSQMENQVAVLEKEIAELENKVSNNTDTSNKANAETEALRESLKKILGDNKLADSIINRLLSSNASQNQMNSLMGNLLGSANLDMSALQSMTSSIMSEDERLLLEKELQLVQLKVQVGMLSTQSSDSLKNVYKTIADSAYDAYNSLATQVNVLNKGWIAEADGFVREVNIKSGESYVSANTSSNNLDISSILASVTSGNYDVSSIVSSFAGQSNKGMVVEYYPLEAVFEISKYDISKISMDQKVVVTTADDKKFDAVINYISAVAEGSSGGIDINALMGTGSGASNTLTAKVLIENADRSVIIGMDVDISAAIETKENVKLLPVEAIQYDNESGYFVFKYDKEEQIITKTPVEVGLFDGSYYEVTKGLDLGDEIVRAPSVAMKDGQRVLPK